MNMKRILSLALSVLMLFALTMPGQVFADEFFEEEFFDEQSFEDFGGDYFEEIIEDPGYVEDWSEPAGEELFEEEILIEEPVNEEIYAEDSVVDTQDQEAWGDIFELPADVEAFNAGIGPAIDLQPENTEAPVGGTVIFHIESSGATRFQWQVCVDGTWKNMSNATTWPGCKTDTLSFKATKANAAYEYRCVAKDDNGSTISDTVTYTMIVKIEKQPVDASAVVGETVTFTVSSSDADTYQWQVCVNGVWKNMSNATTWPGCKTNKLSFKATAANMTYTYRCVLKNAAGGKSLTNEVIITPKPAPIISTQPAGTTAAAGGTVTFKVVSNNTDSYQWQINTGSGWKNMTSTTSWPGCKTNTLSFKATAAKAAYSYRCVLTNGAGETISEEVGFAIIPAPTIDTQPADVTVSVGDTVTFTVASSDADSYQWQVNTGSAWKSMTNATTWPGCKTDTLSFKATKANAAYTYRCLLTNNGGTTESQAVSVKIMPKIDTEPTDAVAGIGDTVTFKVESASAASFQWQIDTGSGWKDMTNATTWPGCKTNTLSFKATAATANYIFRCVLTNTGGTAETQAVKFTLPPAPTIDTQPAEAMAAVGETVTFTVASSNTVSYQWQVNTGSAWKNMTNTTTWPGCKTNTLSFKATAANVNYAYRCVLTNKGGSTTSDEVHFTLKPAPTITEEPVTTTAFMGEMVSFKVTAENADSYQWQVNTGSAWKSMTNETTWLGCKTDTLTFKATIANAKYSYRCVVTNKSGSTESAAVTFTLDPSMFVSGKITYELYEVGSATEARVKSFNSDTDVSVAVPASVTNPIDGATYNVTAIGASAFENKTSLTTVTLPNSIKVIGEKAFKGCTSLSRMNTN